MWNFTRIGVKRKYPVQNWLFFDFVFDEKEIRLKTLFDDVYLYDIDRFQVEYNQLFI